jgi:hypothetical protein
VAHSRALAYLNSTAGDKRRLPRMAQKYYIYRILARLAYLQATGAVYQDDATYATPVAVAHPVSARMVARFIMPG